MVLTKTTDMLIMRVEGNQWLPTIWLDCEYSKVMLVPTIEITDIVLSRTKNEADGFDYTLVRIYDNPPTIVGTENQVFAAGVPLELLDPCIIGIKVKLQNPGSLYLRAKK